MIPGEQKTIFIFIFSLVIIMQSMTKKNNKVFCLYFCLQLTFSILEGFLRLNMHITNDCLVMCVELSCESVVVIIYICILC